MLQISKPKLISVHAFYDEEGDIRGLLTDWGWVIKAGRYMLLGDKLGSITVPAFCSEVDDISGLWVLEVS